MLKIEIMNHITIVGIAASICTAISMLPQLIKIIKEKKAEAISLFTLIVLFAGIIGWVYYGFLKEDMIIIISNSVSLIINFLLLVLTIKYKSKEN